MSHSIRHLLCCTRGLSHSLVRLTFCFLFVSAREVSDSDCYRMLYSGRVYVSVTYPKPCSKHAEGVLDYSTPSLGIERRSLQYLIFLAYVLAFCCFRMLGHCGKAGHRRTGQLCHVSRPNDGILGSRKLVPELADSGSAACFLRA